MEKVKKILILGGNGMLGHMLKNYLANNNFNVITTERSQNSNKNVFKLDVLSNHVDIKHIISIQNPDIIINCIGQLVKYSLTNPKNAIFINSYFPHYVADLCEKNSIKFIHISTDCVFNGKNGPYKESSFKNETNYYGLSKNLGEVIDYQNSITIRTSIIGPEIRKNKTGLFEWIFSQKNYVTGYSKVFWSGITTLELSKFIEFIIAKDGFENKLIHATNNNYITKHDLLSLIIQTFKLELSLTSDLKNHSNKQIINTTNLGYTFQSYSQMINELRSWMILHKDKYEMGYYNL